MSSSVTLPALLTIALLPVASGIYVILSPGDTASRATGLLLILMGIALSTLGFAAFLPAYAADSRTGYVIAIVALSLATMLAPVAVGAPDEHGDERAGGGGTSDTRAAEGD